MERVVHDQLHAYFIENDMFTPKQSGFRKGHSSDTVLTFFTDYVYRKMDQGQLTGAIFLDLRKAFDSVNHQILLGKLYMYGIQGHELAWFKDYLMAADKKRWSVRTNQTGVKLIQEYHRDLYWDHFYLLLW